MRSDDADWLLSGDLLSFAALLCCRSDGCAAPVLMR